MAKKHQGTFQRIDEDEDRGLGPKRILVSGFDPKIEETLLSLLVAIGASEHKVVFCTESMVKLTLANALEGIDDEEPAEPDRLPRAMVLSGLSGTEINTFLKRYGDTGLPRPLFAGVTPINLKFTVGKLLKELIQEQRAMNRRR